jgi:hypothetical protein
VSSWQISIPHRFRDESLIDVGSHCRHLGQDDDRTVMRQIVISAQIDSGLTSAGELLDHIDRLAPAERRALLDEARKEYGLPSIEDVEREQRMAAPLALRPAPLSPTTELRRRENGTFYEVPLTPSRWAAGEGGQLVDLNAREADAARQRAIEDSTRAQRRAREEERAVDAAACDAHRRACAEQVRRELPPGVPG